nr:antiviral innate immune response receptor RIG-I-like isoform X1 [Lytechinus pictus]
MHERDIFTLEKHQSVLEDLETLDLIKLKNDAERMFSELCNSECKREATATQAQLQPEQMEEITRSFASMSVPGTLRSTEPVADDQHGQPQVMNVHPASQMSTQSSRGALRKRPGASVQSDPGVSPNQKPCIQQHSPVDDRSPSPPGSGRVGRAPAGACGQVINYGDGVQALPVQHPSDEPSLKSRDSLPSIKERDQVGSQKTQQTKLLNVQPESSTGSAQPSVPAQPSSGTQEDDDDGGLWLQSSGKSPDRPVNPKIAWAESTTPTQSDQISPLQSREYTPSAVNRTPESSAASSALSGDGALSASHSLKDYVENTRISTETGNMSLDEINDIFCSKDTEKDSICSMSMESLGLDEVEGVAEDFSKMQVNKEKRDEDKEKDDEDEKEKCEIEYESEEEIEEVENMPEDGNIPEARRMSDASASNIEPVELEDENINLPTKKEEMPDSDVGTFESSEGSWPALAVAQQLSDEKARKEEEEAKIEYDPTTGIEKTLYEKMKEHPETLSSAEHDLIKKQMMQHLQKKANPMKKNEPELPFDPEGKLSEYQKELGVPGLLGFNYIICAPSRTGKALTAAVVCNHQRELSLMKQDKKPFKCLFVTPGDAIKERHRRSFVDVFPPSAIVVLDSTFKFREVFDQPSVNVVMMTGVRLSVVLDEGDLEFSEVHTMIIDECHLAASDHPGFGEIIKKYLLEKKRILASKAPKGAWTVGKPYGGIARVIGLTPHLGAGMKQFCRDNIVQQCGLLDSKGIRRVEDVTNLTDLLDTNKPPVIDTMLLTSSSGSSVKRNFRSVVEKIMGEMEEKYAISAETGEEGEAKKLARPPYGTTTYANWIVPLYKESRLCRDEERYAPAMFLLMLNDVLMVNEDLRPKHAMLHLKEVEKLKLDDAFNGTAGTTCYRMATEQIPELKRLSETDRVGLTPKLVCLTQKLEKIYDDKKAIGLVICRSAAVAKYLTKIIEESNIAMAKGIRPLHLEELGECADDGDESERRARQTAILDDFKSEGRINLVISTDFEQVDLELPDCHFVIRYNEVCDELGTIHWSGRKKAKKGHCFFITQKGTMVCRQEEMKREALMELEKHLKVLNEMESKDWYDKVENKQFACMRSNANRDFVVNFQRFNRRARDYTLLCQSCRKFICNAHFLLKRGIYVSCQDSSIKERLSVQGMTSPLRRTDDDVTGVLKCTGQRNGQPCQKKLGFAVDYKRLEVEEGYGLDVKSFFFSYLEGSHADYVGKEFDTWDDVDFFIYVEDREDRQRSDGGGGGGDDGDDDDDMDDNQGGGSADGGDSKKKESGASNVGGGGRTQTTVRARGEETAMETENATQTRQRRPNVDKNVDR